MAKNTPSKTSKSPAKSPAKGIKSSKVVKTSAKSTPSKSTPSKKAPAKAISAKSTPSKSTPSKSTPSKATPSKDVTKSSSKKPKGKIVKAPELEELNDTALVDSKRSAKSKALSTSSLVSSEKINKALSSLKKFIETPSTKSNEKSQLFEDELISDVQIIFNKKDLFTSKKNLKPALIQLDNVTLPKKSIALFVRDDLISKELLEKIEESELNEVLSEIIPGSQLKSTYRQYEKRRELLSKYDIFLSDDALITTLPKLLGKVFYESKKIPIPIKINTKFSIESILKQINEKILKSIVYQIPRSNTLNINLGSIENLDESLIHQVINHFKNEKLSSIFLKSNQSPSLPLYEVDTVYTEEDLIEDEIKPTKTVDDVELTSFEKGLVELAGPDSKLIDLLATKKSKFAKKAAKKSAKETTIKPSKVTKPTVVKSIKSEKPVKSTKSSKLSGNKKKTVKA